MDEIKELLKNRKQKLAKTMILKNEYIDGSEEQLLVIALIKDCNYIIDILEKFLKD